MENEDYYEEVPDNGSNLDPRTRWWASLFFSQWTTFWSNLRDADTDNVSSIIPIDFGKKYRIYFQPVPFRRNMLKAITVDFVAFRRGYLDWGKKLKT